MVQKRLVVCCDGTWQSSATHKKNIPSNVSRLCRLLAREGTNKQGEAVPQVVYYDAGIGTGDLTAFGAAHQGGTGHGMDTNIIEAYNFLVLNWKEGDEIYCFGFSRGAYTARSLAGFITDVGICEPEDLMYLHEAWKVYQDNKGAEPFQECEGFNKWKNESTGHANKFLERGTAQVNNSNKVKVIGVWDTVGALGVPNLTGITGIPYFTGDDAQYGFHNVRLSPDIENAFQALALDEQRGPFSPTLFRRPKTNTTTNVKQVWFPGVHINIGGGSDDQLDAKGWFANWTNDGKGYGADNTKKGVGDFEEMANITLAWMIEQVSEFLAFNKDQFNHQLEVQDQHRKEFSDKHKDEYSGYIFRTKRVAPDNSRGWGTGPQDDSVPVLYKAAGSIDRTPGQYHVPPRPKGEKPGREKPEGDGSSTFEEIHPVAGFRKEKVGAYKPRGLRDWERREVSGGGYEWHLPGTYVVLPEYKIPKTTKDDSPINLERVVITSEAEDHIKKIDKGNFGS